QGQSFLRCKSIGRETCATELALREGSLGRSIDLLRRVSLSRLCEQPILALRIRSSCDLFVSLPHFHSEMSTIVISNICGRHFFYIDRNACVFFYFFHDARHICVLPDFIGDYDSGLLERA